MTIKLVRRKDSKDKASADLKKQSAFNNIAKKINSKHQLNIPDDLDVALIIGERNGEVVILDRKCMPVPELVLFLELTRKQIIEEFEEVIHLLKKE